MASDGMIAALVALAEARSHKEVQQARLSIARLAQGEAWEHLVDAVARRSLEALSLERLAAEDALTGLANRRCFTCAVQRELARRGRTVGPAVVLLDLDGLKTINDRHGHAAGDEAIRLVAACCVEGVRANDLPARLGGDEFAILLPETDLEGARAVAKRVRKLIERQGVAGEALRTSLGIAVADADDIDAGALVAAADRRLYRDKRARKSEAPRLAA
jgi:diguanylate cyclase (GGDEF)-like protein